MDEKEERFKKQMDFILTLDQEKNVFRRTHLSGHGRNENDAEHSWHMAVMVYLLREYANEDIDLAKTMMMCLIHDAVEIYADDTYAYDTEGKKTQRQREEAAADKLFGMLPDDQRNDLRALFEEFDSCETPEARFANAMDNFQPLTLNDSNRGVDWVSHDIKKSQVMKRNEKTRLGSEFIYQHVLEILDKNVKRGSLKPD